MVFHLYFFLFILPNFFYILICLLIIIFLENSTYLVKLFEIGGVSKESVIKIKK